MHLVNKQILIGRLKLPIKAKHNAGDLEQKVTFQMITYLVMKNL